MKMKKYISLFVFIGVSLLAYGQDDTRYSQYMFNGIYVNPAYSGYKQQLNVYAYYRNQWLAIEGAPRTISLAVDVPAREGDLGFSLIAGGNQFAAQASNWAYLNFAYRLRINSDEENRLALGLGVGLVQKSLDGTKLIPEQPNDPYIPTTLVTQSLPDAKIGAYYSTDRWYAGISVENLLASLVKPTQYKEIIFFNDKAPHYYVTGGVLVPINETVQVKPSFMVKQDQAYSMTADVNLLFLIKDKIWIGPSYRTVKLYNQPKYSVNGSENIKTQQTLVGMIEFFVSDKMRIGYAYDHTLSDTYKTITNGIHEFSIGFFLPPRKELIVTPRRF